MRNLDKVAESLFDKIRGRFEKVTLGDESSNSTQDPRQARFFNFDFVSSNGKNFGNITISIVDSDSLKIFFSKNISKELLSSEKVEWFDFLKNIRHFAKRNLLSFDTRDISRASLTQKDVSQMSTADATLQISDIKHKLKEATEPLSGTTKTSYQKIGPVKLTVKHTGIIDPEKRGSRTRNVESIFFETDTGERFKSPTNSLSGARAFAQHIAAGGNMYDDKAVCIHNMISEMDDMRVFVRNMKHRTFEDTTTQDMVEAATQRFFEIKKNLKKISGSKGYGQFWMNYAPSEPGNDGDISELKERFVKKIFDDRFEKALPHVYNAYNNRKKEQMNPKGFSEFEEWMNETMSTSVYRPEEQYVSEDTPDFVEEDVDYSARIGKKTPNQLGAADFWYHRGSIPEYYGFEKGSSEYLQYKAGYKDMESQEGQSGGKDYGINEGTWATPDTQLVIDKLQEIMNVPFEAGIDGEDATAILYDIIGDDSLFDAIQEVGKSDSKADVRIFVYDWIMTNMPELKDKLDFSEFEKQLTSGDESNQEETQSDSGDIDNLKKLSGIDKMQNGM